MIATWSPGAIPSVIRPSASASISPAASAQVQLCQIPNYFSRYAGRSANSRAFRNSSRGTEHNASLAAPEGAKLSSLAGFTGARPLPVRHNISPVLTQRQYIFLNKRSYNRLTLAKPL